MEISYIRRDSAKILIGMRKENIKKKELNHGNLQYKYK